MAEAPAPSPALSGEPGPQGQALAAEPPLVTEPPALHWPSALLLRGRQEVSIEHKGAVYRLRLTRQDKLILTK